MVLMKVTAVLVVMALGVTTVSAEDCDTFMTNKMASLYPDGLPTGILDKLSGYEDMSYRWVSKNSAIVGGTLAECIKVVVSGNKGQCDFKFALMTVPYSYTLSEDTGKITQTDGVNTYNMYPLTMDRGVVTTGRCCQTCGSGAKQDVGMAVANSMKDQEDTLAAISAAKDILKDIEDNLQELQSC